MAEVSEENEKLKQELGKLIRQNNELREELRQRDRVAELMKVSGRTATEIRCRQGDRKRRHSVGSGGLHQQRHSGRDQGKPGCGH